MMVIHHPLTSWFHMQIQPGDPAPLFKTRAYNRPDYQFAATAGRYVALLFVQSATRARCQKAVADSHRLRHIFNDRKSNLFIVSADPLDESDGRLNALLPGIRVFWDSERQIFSRYGVTSCSAASPDDDDHPCLLVLDPNLRGLCWFTWHQSGPSMMEEVGRYIESLPDLETGPARMQAPVLLLPRVFEPDFCRQLISYYEASEPHDSGYMKPLPDGRIAGMIDHKVKRRRDCLIEDEPLRRAVQERIERRLIPEILKSFRFKVTRIERYLIACYDGDEQGFFRPHRDNDGEGYRQFAVSINLNSEEFEGGDLKFPEFGQQTYRPSTGGACVFACSLLHEATRVVRGRRYVVVPFLYDEAAALRREELNSRYVDSKHHYARA